MDLSANNDDLGQIAFGAKTGSIDNTNNDSVMIRGVADQRQIWNWTDV